MTVVGESGLPPDAGRRDALHHRERLRKKITEQLKERIGEEDIIAAGPEKKVRVPVKGTKRWQFILDRDGKRASARATANPATCSARGRMRRAKARRAPSQAKRSTRSGSTWTMSRSSSSRSSSCRG